MNLKSNLGLLVSRWSWFHLLYDWPSWTQLSIAAFYQVISLGKLINNNLNWKAQTGAERKLPEVRSSLIVHMKISTTSVKPIWYVVIGLCPLNSINYVFFSLFNCWEIHGGAYALFFHIAECRICSDFVSRLQPCLDCLSVYAYYFVTIVCLRAQIIIT